MVISPKSEVGRRKLLRSPDFDLLTHYFSLLLLTLQYMSLLPDINKDERNRTNIGYGCTTKKYG